MQRQRFPLSFFGWCRSCRAGRDGLARLRNFWRSWGKAGNCPRSSRNGSTSTAPRSFMRTASSMTIRGSIAAGRLSLQDAAGSMTAMTGMTAVLGCPLMLALTRVTPPIFYPKRRAEDKAGRSPARRESRGNVWHTALCRAKCSVLHPVNAVGKIFPPVRLDFSANSPCLF